MLLHSPLLVLGASYLFIFQRRLMRRLPLFSITQRLLRIASAQTYTNCDPTNVTCPPTAGLDSDFYSIDFTQVTSQPSDWSVPTWCNVTFNTNGRRNGAEFEFLKRYDSPNMESNFYFLFGRAEYVVQAAPGPGIISDMMLLSDDLDELDWEFRGTLDYEVQTGWFGKGITGLYNHSITPNVSTPMTEFHTYAYDWTPERVNWENDGVVIRTLQASDCVGTSNQYPQTPMKVMMGLWDAGDPDHYDPWSAGMTPIPPPAEGYSFYVKSVKVWNSYPAKCYNWTDHSGDWQSIQILNDVSLCNDYQASSSTVTSSSATPSSSNFSSLMATSTAVFSPLSSSSLIVSSIIPFSSASTSPFVLLVTALSPSAALLVSVTTTVGPSTGLSSAACSTAAVSCSVLSIISTVSLGGSQTTSLLTRVWSAAAVLVSQSALSEVPSSGASSSKLLASEYIAGPSSTCLQSFSIVFSGSSLFGPAPPNASVLTVSRLSATPGRPVSSNALTSLSIKVNVPSESLAALTSSNQTTAAIPALSREPSVIISAAVSIPLPVSGSDLAVVDSLMNLSGILTSSKASTPTQLATTSTPMRDWEEFSEGVIMTSGANHPLSAVSKPIVEAIEFVPLASVPSSNGAPSLKSPMSFGGYRSILIKGGIDDSTRSLDSVDNTVKEKWYKAAATSSGPFVSDLQSDKAESPGLANWPLSSFLEITPANSVTALGSISNHPLISFPSEGSTRECTLQVSPTPGALPSLPPTCQSYNTAASSLQTSVIEFAELPAMETRSSTSATLPASVMANSTVERSNASVEQTQEDPGSRLVPKPATTIIHTEEDRAPAWSAKSFSKALFNISVASQPSGQNVSKSNFPPMNRLPRPADFSGQIARLSVSKAMSVSPAPYHHHQKHGQHHHHHKTKPMSYSSTMDIAETTTSTVTGMEDSKAGLVLESDAKGVPTTSLEDSSEVDASSIFASHSLLPTGIVSPVKPLPTPLNESSYRTNAIKYKSSLESPALQLSAVKFSLWSVIPLDIILVNLY